MEKVMRLFQHNFFPPKKAFFISKHLEQVKNFYLTRKSLLFRLKTCFQLKHFQEKLFVFVCLSTLFMVPRNIFSDV